MQNENPESKYTFDKLKTALSRYIDTKQQKVVHCRECLSIQKVCEAPLQDVLLPQRYAGVPQAAQRILLYFSGLSPLVPDGKRKHVFCLQREQGFEN